MKYMKPRQLLKSRHPIPTISHKTVKHNETDNTETQPTDENIQEVLIININTATKDDLISLPYIGGVKAQAIIDYRTTNGPFKTIEDIVNVKGIGPKTLEKLRPYITV